MAWKWLIGALVISVGLTVCRALAGESPTPPSISPISEPPALDSPGPCSILQDLGASCERKNRFVPTMFGDLLGFLGGQPSSQLGQSGQFGQFGQNLGGQFGQFGQQLGQFGGQFGAPVAVARGAFKITENESPIPQDRVWLSYSYYDNVRKIADVHREIAAFEKSFLDGSMSLGVRLPYFQLDGPGGISEQELDDLSVVAKAALWRDSDSLTALSAGLVVTAPTGSAGFTPSGQRIHPTLLQPFLGWFWDVDNLYLIGFSACMFPTDSRDVTLMFNDFGLGYWLYRSSGDGLLAGVVPTCEVHVNTPLSDRGRNDPNRYADSVNLTSGCNWVFRCGSSLGAAIGVPLTGPKLFDLEAIVHFNWRF
jgi:hypothetical protein